MSDSPDAHDSPPAVTNETSSPAAAGSFSWKRVVGTVLTLVLIGGIGAGATWYVMNSKPAVYRVQGIVLLDGEPMEGGVINTFHTKGYPGARGGIDKDGKFDLMTDGYGAYAGEHKVSFALMGPGMPPQSLIPEKYTDPNSSGFTINVTAESSNEELKFELFGRKEAKTRGGDRPRDEDDSEDSSERPSRAEEEGAPTTISE